MRARQNQEGSAGTIPRCGGHPRHIQQFVVALLVVRGELRNQLKGSSVMRKTLNDAEGYNIAQHKECGSWIGSPGKVNKVSMSV